MVREGGAAPMRALITGSGGLIGSACARLLLDEGWKVDGIDNDMRSGFFGVAASTKASVKNLELMGKYRHWDIDICHQSGLRGVVDLVRPDLIIHTAAQPSHDKAAEIPELDFQVNAVGTMNLLVAARDFVPKSPFVF